VLELAVIGARLAQYCGAAVLFGSSLFFVYAPGFDTAPRWARRLIAGAASLLAIGSLAGIAAQASLFAGSFAEGLSREALGTVVSSMDLGKAALVRTGCAAAALLVILSGGFRCLLAAALGAVATASLAWMGHGAATEGVLGAIHLVSDVLHALAAAAWIGVLAVFAGLLLTANDAEGRARMHGALEGFSGLGSVLVAALLLTGLVNGWVLVGQEGVGEMLSTAYGRLLSLKVILFLVMVALAGRNRFRLVPALGHAPTDASIGALRCSVMLETAAALAILGIVSWLGTLAPPAAS
jgi:putative copper resistance protein D